MNFDRKHLSYTTINGKSFEEFKSFLDSLDEEKKTWSFDKQTFKDEKEWYDCKDNLNSMFLLYKGKIIGFSNGYVAIKDNGQTHYEISFVVKKEYQGKGLGTQILLIVERNIRKTPNVVTRDEKGVTISRQTIVEMVAKHHIDNIASHKAFLKAGWRKAEIYADGKRMDNPTLMWMIKKL